MHRYLATIGSHSALIRHPSAQRVRPHSLFLTTVSSPVPAIITHITRGMQLQQLSCDQMYHRITKMSDTRRSSERENPRGLSVPLSMVSSCRSMRATRVLGRSACKLNRLWQHDYQRQTSRCGDAAGLSGCFVAESQTEKVGRCDPSIDGSRYVSEALKRCRAGYFRRDNSPEVR
jgi:hypothetical protein